MNPSGDPSQEPTLGEAEFPVGGNAGGNGGNAGFEERNPDGSVYHAEGDGTQSSLVITSVVSMFPRSGPVSLPLSSSHLTPTPTPIHVTRPMGGRGFMRDAIHASRSLGPRPVEYVRIENEDPDNPGTPRRLLNELRGGEYRYMAEEMARMRQRLAEMEAENARLRTPRYQYPPPRNILDVALGSGHQGQIRTAATALSFANPGLGATPPIVPARSVIQHMQRTPNQGFARTGTPDLSNVSNADF